MWHVIKAPKQDPNVDAAVAQELQERLEALNAGDPPRFDVPFFLASYRHPCTARAGAHAGRGVSTNMDCPEHYMAHEDGVHAMLYREGKCKACKQTGRSSFGRVVLMAERPPAYGRVARD